MGDKKTEALALKRSTNMSVREIARKIGRSSSAVQKYLNPVTREKAKLWKRRGERP